jgi:iron(III) transport system ATP-binding protein
MDVIRIDGLRKSFPGSDRLAVDHLSLEIPAGTFFTLLGPSGCGKSTTLRCIAGLERPEAGEIVVGGTTVFSSRLGINLPPHRRPIGMVFQSYAVWPHMTVRENVAYPLRNLRKSRSEVEESVDWALRMVGLESMAGRPAPLLSGGEQQRVAFARALVARPNVLLLDEPLSNLDAKLREAMRLELRELQEKLAFTAVYVTHDQEEAFSLSDTLALIHGGKVVELGAPEAVYRTPATTFGAEFLGTATKLQGTVIGHDEAGYLAVAVPIGTLLCRSREPLPIGSEVFAYVRPEDVRLADAGGSEQGALIVEARVVQTSFMGGVLDWAVETQGIRIKAKSLAGLSEGRSIGHAARKPLGIKIIGACCVPLSGSPLIEEPMVRVYGSDIPTAVSAPVAD